MQLERFKALGFVNSKKAWDILSYIYILVDDEASKQEIVVEISKRSRMKQNTILRYLRFFKRVGIIYYDRSTIKVMQRFKTYREFIDFCVKYLTTKYDVIIKIVNELISKGYKLNENYIAYILEKQGIKLAPRTVADIIFVLKSFGLIMHRRGTVIIDRNLEKAIIELFRSNGGSIKTDKLIKELTKIGFQTEEIEALLLKMYINNKIGVAGQDEKLRELYKIIINNMPGISTDSTPPREGIIGLNKIREELSSYLRKDKNEILDELEKLSSEDQAHVILERDLYDPNKITIAVKPINDEDELLIIEGL